MKLLTAYLILITVLVLQSCDGGLSPENVEAITPGFSGKIIFKGNWPQDIQSTYIILFKDSLKDADDFNATNLKYVSAPIPNGTREFDFNTLEDISFGAVLPGRYAYLAVAQSASPIISLVRSAWTVAGVFHDKENNYPEGTIVIPENTFIENIEILCDFDNPPDQPPG